MAETDVFERRLRGALVRHTDGAPTDFDALGFARLVAEKEPRRHGLGAVLGWRRGGVPRAARVLLLVGLLAALAVGTLAVGSQLQRKAPAVMPAIGQVFECSPGSNPDEPGPVDQARPVEDARMSMAFDRRAGRVVAVVGVDDAVETWTFDVCTNTWTRMLPDQEPFGWVELVYDIGSDRTVGVTSCRDCVLDPHGVVWAYDLQANAWNEAGAAPTDVTALIYDPVAGLVVAVGDAGDPYTSPPALWSYDVEAGTWVLMYPANELNLDGLVAYDASVDRIVAYGGTADPESVDRGTRLLDIRTGNWSWSDAVTPGIWGSGFWGAPPAIAYDEAAQRTVVFGGGLAAYDATADRWEILVDPDDRDPSDWLPSSMVYDPVNRRLIGLGRGVGVDQGGVVAFDLVTREWTVLLEPSDE